MVCFSARSGDPSRDPVEPDPGARVVPYLDFYVDQEEPEAFFGDDNRKSWVNEDWTQSSRVPWV